MTAPPPTPSIDTPHSDAAPLTPGDGTQTEDNVTAGRIPPRAQPSGVSALRAKLVDAAPAIARAARDTAAGLREQVRAFDVRKRVMDLSRAQEPFVPHPATAATLPTPPAVLAPAAIPLANRTIRQEPTRAASWFSRNFLLGCLFAAGVAHIVTVLALPSIGSGGAYQRLKSQLPVNTMAVLPMLSPGAHIPYLSPDMRYAMCRYDISMGPLAVTATLPEAGWSIAIHTPDGENIYLVPGQDQRRTELEFTLTRSSERSLITPLGVRRSDVDATQVTSPRAEGLVVLRAPVRGTAYKAETEAILRAAKCREVLR
jgi:uncharacterized membrane protein